MDLKTAVAPWFSITNKKPPPNKQYFEMQTNSTRKMTLPNATFKEFRKLKFFMVF